MQLDFIEVAAGLIECSNHVDHTAAVEESPICWASDGLHASASHYESHGGNDESNGNDESHGSNVPDVEPSWIDNDTASDSSLSR